MVSSNANWQVAMHPFDIYPDESYQNIQGVWTKWTNDLAFRTYVIPAEVDPVDPTIEEVIATTVTDPDVAASLQDMVDQIKNAPNAKAKAGKLKAFLNQLKAQTGKSISEEDAETLAEIAKDL